MTDAEKWRTILWSFVDLNLELGEDFIFSVDASQLISLALDKGLKLEDKKECISSLRDALRDFVVVGSPKSWIREGLKSGDDDPSFAICFAAQQVLAVEEMVAEGGTSANNYYRRYREILGLTHDEGIPFDYWQFEKIWKIFADELRHFRGVENENITFKRGVGIDKYRFYPLSQSLLDRQSLRWIHQRIKNIQRLDQYKLIERIRSPRVRPHLTTRSQKKVDSNLLKDAILNQVRAFDDAQAPAEKNVRQKQALVKQADVSDFKLYQDEDEDFNEFCVVRFDPQADSIFSDTQGLEAFDHCIQILKCEPIILFYHDSERFKAIEFSEAAKLSVSFSWALVRQSSRAALDYLFGEEAFLVGDAKTPSGLELYDVSNLDFENKDSKEVSIKNELGFGGGLCVNRSTNTYLQFHPPSGLMFNDERIADTEKIDVGDIKENVSDFLARMITEPPSRHRLRYLGCETRLTISAEKDDVDKPLLGFRLIDGQLDTCTSALVEGEDSLQHCVVHGSLLAEKASSYPKLHSTDELIKHLLLPQNQWMDISEEKAVEISQLIERFLGRTAQGSYFRRMIETKQKIPVTLFRHGSGKVRRQLRS